MKKAILILLSLIIATGCGFCAEVYSENNKFGLVDGNEKITEAKYKKLIRLGESSYLFLYKTKYGIMNEKGEILLEPKFSRAERYVGRFAKLSLKGKYGLYNDKGEAVINPEYNSIDILYGRMFLVKKNYKYGLIDFDGDILLAPIADDIYMPEKNILKLSYDGAWYEITHISKDTMELPKDMTIDDKGKEFKIIRLVEQPITTTGYGIVSAGDYFIKIFSSMSPAYEQTVDELILSHGADTALILLNPVWLAKFPFVYGKNYVNNFKTPNNGPLADVKTNLKNKFN